MFKSKLFSFIRPVQSNIYIIFDSKGLTFLIRLRLGLSHVNEHRLRRNFKDCMNPLYSCSPEIENTSHYLLHSHHLSTVIGICKDSGIDVNPLNIEVCHRLE